MGLQILIHKIEKPGKKQATQPVDNANRKVADGIRKAEILFSPLFREVKF